MKLTVQNQKPIILNPVHQTQILGQINHFDTLKNMIVHPIFTPLHANMPVVIKDDQNNIVTDDDVTGQLLLCLDESINSDAESFMKDLFSQTLIHYNKAPTVLVQETFVSQAAAMEKLPEPSNTVIYSPSTDIIPACKLFLGGKGSYEMLFVSFAFTVRPETLGVYFATNQDFDEFKQYLYAQTQSISNMLPPDTNSLLAQFQQLDLNCLTESIRLRDNDGDNDHDLSFARILHHYLMEYMAQSPNNAGLFPFQLGELVSPKTIVFINIEHHSHATAKAITEEWAIIHKSLQMKVKVVDPNKLNRLTATVRSAKTIQSAVVNVNSKGSAQKAANVKFRSKPLTTLDMTKIIQKVVNKMTNVNKSENSFKTIKTTFARPNRRDPDDYNKMGKMTNLKYKPDIHIYLDTSGSVSERNYQDAIKSLIQMARKLNVNLYFNSFSSLLSACTHLKTKDRSVSQIYAQFQKIPKVTGGTDYEQIWRYIEQSPKRKKELSLIITDFQYTPPNRVVAHGKNIYYLPLSQMDWGYMIRHATHFSQSMMHICPNIRTKILF